MSDDFHLTDSGKFLITCTKEGEILDVSAAVTKQIIFKKKDGTLLIVDAQFETDGRDGKVYHQFLPNDLDIVGKWQFQVFVIWSASEQRHSSIGTFEIANNLV